MEKKTDLGNGDGKKIKETIFVTGSLKNFFFPIIEMGSKPQKSFFGSINYLRSQNCMSKTLFSFCLKHYLHGLERCNVFQLSVLAIHKTQHLKRKIIFISWVATDVFTVFNCN